MIQSPHPHREFSLCYSMFSWLESPVDLERSRKLAVATGDDNRLAVTNQALRELSGVNGLLVWDWIKAHADEVISHNSKDETQNPKDPSNPTTYYNKRHGAEKIAKILNLINERFLDGEAQQNACNPCNY